MRECAVARPTPESSTAKWLSSSRHEASIARVYCRAAAGPAPRGCACAAGPMACASAESVELDRDQRELAVLARGQVDLAAQLILEVHLLVQAGDVVAQALVLRLAAQRLGGLLLLLELRERELQLDLACALRAAFRPDAHQRGGAPRRRGSATRATPNSRRAAQLQLCARSSALDIASAAFSAVRSAGHWLASSHCASAVPVIASACCPASRPGGR